MDSSSNKSTSQIRTSNADVSERLTPIMFSFSDPDLTSVDIKRFLDIGLNKMSFRLAHMPLSEKRKLMIMIKRAVTRLCHKNDVNAWPLNISIDIPNYCIRTGWIKNDETTAGRRSITLKQNSSVIITSQLQYWDKCDEERICIDDQYILSTVKPKTEMTINFGQIVLVFKERFDPQTIKCEVVVGGRMKSEEMFSVNDPKCMKPILSKNDIELLEFAKEFNFDIVTMNSIHHVGMLKRVRNFFSNERRSPSIISTICDKEGLANIDDIIKESDGIILAREILVHKVPNINKMAAIQLQVGAKCKKYGKPFFISGNILEQALHTGNLTGCENSDLTNIILQGAGILIKNVNDTHKVLKAIRIITSISEVVEPLIADQDFWRMYLEMKMPVNAAEACVLSCVILANCSLAVVIIVPTVTGRTVKQLMHMAPKQIILAVTTNPSVANKLLLYRGVIPVIYQLPPDKNWCIETQARIDYAIAYAIKHNYLKYGQHYVTLRKSFPYSAFCDNVSVWRVITEETKKRMVKAGNKLLKTASGSHIEMI